MRADTRCVTTPKTVSDGKISKVSCVRSTSKYFCLACMHAATAVACYAYRSLCYFDTMPNAISERERENLPTYELEVLG